MNGYVYIVQRGDELDVFNDEGLAREWAQWNKTQVITERFLDRDTIDAMKGEQEEGEP